MSRPVVVKLGGSILEDDAVRGRALDAIAALRRDGRDVVVVHGGGKRIDGWLSRLGIPRRIHAGLRVTDAPTRDVVVAVLAGLVSTGLVAELAARGVGAVGLSGADGAVLEAARHHAVDGVDLGWVGDAPVAEPALLRALLASGRLPLLASLALCPADGQLLNVNADAAAAAVAVALGAGRLVFLTDVEAVRDGSGRELAELPREELAQLLASPAVAGGMRPKLEACRRALEAGVAVVEIAGPSRHAATLAGAPGGTSLRRTSPAIAAGRPPRN